MKKFTMAAAGLALSASTATAGGLDRSYTPVDLMFEKGNHLEFSMGWTDPSLSGTAPPAGAISNVANSYTTYGAGLRVQIFDNVALGIILDQPYGADVLYGGNPAATMLGGTSAKASSSAATILLQYQINDRFSVYGGPRWVDAKGDITLGGFAYGPIGSPLPSVFNFASDTGLGYVVGVAYERAEMGQRLSVTYHSEVDLAFNTSETIGGAVVPGTRTTNTSTPQSLEIAGQTGLNPQTLLFGSVRWSDWSKFTLIPPTFGRNLSSLQDAWTFEIGVGRKFSDKFSGSLTYTHELAGASLVSPLSPNNGLDALTVAGKYQVTEKVSLSGGVRYTMLGNAQPQTGGIARGSFTGNDAISVGLKVGIDLN